MSVNGYFICRGAMGAETLTVSLAASAWLCGIKVTTVGSQTRALHVLLAGALALALGARAILVVATCPRGLFRRGPGVTAV